MLGVGERAPLEAGVWTTPRERASVGELLGGGPILLLFYLFDWSAT
ncbi:MAG TPA: hypothetical protein VFJ77_02615 [Gaiellaceae bacterium]|nr:hypothetical protein [Gaiellaceae bacterium]